MELDKIEAAGREVVSVKFVLDMITMLAPLVPTINTDQAKFKQIVLDILKQITDGQPNLPPPAPAPNTTTVNVTGVPSGVPTARFDALPVEEHSVNG